MQSTTSSVNVRRRTDNDPSLQCKNAIAQWRWHKKLHIHQVRLAIYELNRNPVLQTPDPREEYAKGVDQAGVLVSPAVSLSRRIVAMDGRPLKPKRMHWRTYRRLEAALEHYEALGMARIMQSLVRGIR